MQPSHSSQQLKWPEHCKDQYIQWGWSSIGFCKFAQVTLHQRIQGNILVPKMWVLCFCGEFLRQA